MAHPKRNTCIRWKVFRPFRAAVDFPFFLLFLVVLCLSSFSSFLALVFLSLLSFLSPCAPFFALRSFSPSFSLFFYFAVVRLFAPFDLGELAASAVVVMVVAPAAPATMLVVAVFTSAGARSSGNGGSVYPQLI